MSDDSYFTLFGLAEAARVSRASLSRQISQGKLKPDAWLMFGHDKNPLFLAKHVSQVIENTKPAWGGTKPAVPAAS